MTRIVPVSLVLALTLLAVRAANAQEAPSQPSLSAEQIAELEAGEVIVHTQRGAMNRGDVVGLVCAPLDEVWAIIRDFNQNHTWYPDMLESTLVASGRGRGVTDMPWPISNRNWEIEMSQSVEDVGGIESHVGRYQYVQGSGNLEEMYGFWLVRPWPNGCTLVRYVLNADIGVALPSGIINWAARRMLPGIVTGLRERWDQLH
jgi:hypothetical protein